LQVHLIDIPVPSSGGLARKKDSSTVNRNVRVAGAVEVGRENPSGAIGGEQDEPGRWIKIGSRPGTRPWPEFSGRPTGRPAGTWVNTTGISTAARATCCLAAGVVGCAGADSLPSRTKKAASATSAAGRLTREEVGQRARVRSDDPDR